VLLVEAALVYPGAPGTRLAGASTSGSVELHTRRDNLAAWDQLLELGAADLDLQRAVLVLQLTTVAEGEPAAGAPVGARAGPPGPGA
jgi:hypothetical protein